MQKMDPLALKDNVLTKHLDTIKSITKSFIDSTQEDFKQCSPFAAFVAWASQFVIYCRHAQQEDKVEKQIKALEKELDNKGNKKQTIINILDSFNKDGYIAFFQQEIQGDEERIGRYRQFNEEIVEECVEQQKVYLNFEKGFFQGLEENVIQKKVASNLVKQMKRKTI